METVTEKKRKLTDTNKIGFGIIMGSLGCLILTILAFPENPLNIVCLIPLFIGLILYK